MTPDQLHEFANRYTSAWNAHDAAGAAACFAEDGSLAINGGEPAVGRAAVQAVIQSFCDAFPDGQTTMDLVRGVGDHAVYLWTYEGTNTGPGGTGKRVRFSGWETWAFSADGRIARSLGSFDAAEYERQVAEGV